MTTAEQAISATCEVVLEWSQNGGITKQCRQPTTHAYPAMGGGHMALCETHAQQHIGSAEAIGMIEVSPPPDELSRLTARLTGLENRAREAITAARRALPQSSTTRDEVAAAWKALDALAAALASEGQ